MTVQELINELMKVKDKNGGITMWIARDKYGDLFIYENKPIKTEYGSWEDPTNPYKYYGITGDAFPEVRLEDEEPRELVLKPINKE